MCVFRKIAVISLSWLAVLPLWGGTGRSSDGFLSFIILLGFLLILLGILHLTAYAKRRIREMLEDFF
jgi:hypothetical protein